MPHCGQLGRFLFPGINYLEFNECFGWFDIKYIFIYCHTCNFTLNHKWSTNYLLQHFGSNIVFAFQICKTLIETAWKIFPSIIDIHSSKKVLWWIFFLSWIDAVFVLFCLNFLWQKSWYLLSFAKSTGSISFIWWFQKTPIVKL